MSNQNWYRVPLFPEDQAWLAALKVGDRVHRWLGGFPMSIEVTAIKGDRIVCALWEFDRLTGAEIDEEIGWGPTHGITGSYIRPPGN